MFDALGTLFRENQFLSGGMIVMLAGAALAYCRRMPQKLTKMFVRSCTVTIDVQDDDESYQWLTRYLAEKLGDSRFVSVQTRRRSSDPYPGDTVDEIFEQYYPDESRKKSNRPDILLVPAPGSYYFWFEGRPVFVSRDRNDVTPQGGQGGVMIGRKESFTIRILGRDRAIAKRLIEEARNKSLPEDGKIEIRVSRHNHWHLSRRITPRSFESVILDKNYAVEILRDVEEFLASGPWYNELGIPWRRGYLFEGGPGNGKCLAKGTPVMMFDGTIKLVEAVRSGDLLMGPDSLPRMVKGTTSGREQLYKVVPKKGSPYVVNESHILSLKMSCAAGGHKKGELVNVSVADYLNKSNKFKHQAKGWRTGVDFPAQPVELDPYILGVWLGDGTASKPEVTTGDEAILAELRKFADDVRLVMGDGYAGSGCKSYPITSGPNRVGAGQHGENVFLNLLRWYGVFDNKHIPHCYKANSRAVRLGVLAGLMDTDGSENYGGYDYVTESAILAADVAFLARSLGFAAYVNTCQKTCTNNGKIGTYHRVLISGDLSEVPVRLKRKACGPRRQKKSVLVTGISVEKLDVGEYYGFELDGDGLFLLGDFTVTHNTSFATALASKLQLPIYILNLSQGDMSDERLSELLNSVPSQAIVLMEDIDCAFADRNRVGPQLNSDRLTFSGLLNAFDGIAAQDGRLLFLTTNHPERLDGALIRPGRVDVKVHIGNASREQASRMFVRFYQDCGFKMEGWPHRFAEQIADGEFSMAELQGHLMRHKTDPVTAVEAVADLRESVKREREEWHALAAAATARPVRDEEGE